MTIIDGVAPTAVARLAERICNQVHRSVGAGERLEPVTVSVGVAFRKPGQGIDKLLKAADDAVYRAKATGKNRVRAPKLRLSRVPAEETSERIPE